MPTLYETISAIGSKLAKLGKTIMKSQLLEITQHLEHLAWRRGANVLQ